MVFDSEILQNGFYTQGLTIRPIEVKYQNTPVTLSLNDFARSRHILNENPMTDTITEVTETIGTKSTAWAYEKEFRLLSLEEKNSQTHSSEALQEIVIGEKMPQGQQKLVIDTAKTANPNIKVKLAKLKLNSYQLEVIEYTTA